MKTATKKVAGARRVQSLRSLTIDEVLVAIETGKVKLDQDVLVPLLLGGSITSSELVFYNAANEPTDSVSTGGGAIDTLRRPDFTQLTQAGGEKVDVVSSNAGDTTQTLTLTGRLVDGSLVSETISLNGTVTVSSTNTYERVLKAELSATCTGNVTTKGHTSTTVFRIIPAGERGYQAIFQQLASDPVSTTTWYAKFFIKNTDATLALTSSVVKENADPSGVIDFGLAGSLNDSVTIANRITAPGGIAFASTAVNVPNSQNLSSGSAIGVWLRLTLAGGNAALKTSWTGEIDGNTT